MKPNVDLVNLIATQELGSPPGTITVNDLINIWPDGSLRGYKYTINQLAQIISTQLGSGSILVPRVYRIGVDMPSGSYLSTDRRQIIDPYLNNKVYSVHRRGIEWMIKGIEWDNTVPDGGIQLLQDDSGIFDIFTDGEIITVSFAPQFSPYIPTPDAIARFTAGEQIITTNSTITSGMFRKLIRAQGSNTQLSINLPVSTDYPENVILCIVSDGGNHIQLQLNCAGTENIFYEGNWPSFWLNRGEQIQLIRTTGGWAVVNFTGATRIQRIGTIDFGYIVGKNQIALTSDTPLNRSDYPGIWDFIKKLSVAQPGAVVPNSTWVNNKGLFGLGDGDLSTGTTFNLPVVSGRFPRYADPNGILDKDRYNSSPRTSNLPGSYQSDAIKTHTITVGSTGWRILMRHVGITGGGLGVNNAPTGYEEAISNVLTYQGNPNESRPYNTLGIPLFNY